ncbi:MAG: hypothetical protein DHS20C11_03350 [Lysobacteraceae bacterium]|nr:MAG: hypothetical protein DHS20C11_03350 [Xanthomonadaceae bacterium]
MGSSIYWRLCAAVLVLAGTIAMWPEAETPRKPGKSPADGDDWAVRLTYPTFQFDGRWIAAARLQDQAIERGLPAGVVERAAKGLGFDGILPDDRFVSLGPKPLESGSSNYGGRVNVIISDPSDDSVAYFGSDGGGVWKTTNCCDSNTTWFPTTDDPSLNSIAIGDMTMDPADPNILYAGTGDLRYGSFSFGSAGLLKTTNGGASWEILGEDVFNAVYDQPAGNFPQYQAIGKVVVDPRDSDNVIVGTKTGLYLSYDAGQNWDGPCYTNGFSDQRQDTTGLLAIDRTTHTELVVAIGTRGHNTTVQPDLTESGANGIYYGTLPVSGCPMDFSLSSRSDNGWPGGTGGGVGFPNNPLGRIDIAMAPSDNDVIYAEVASPSTRGLLGVWRTTDGGVTWQQRATASDLLGCFGDWGQNWYDQGLSVDPLDSDTVYMSTVDLFRSDNGGDTFTNVTCGYAGGPGTGDFVHVDHHSRAYVDGDPSRILIGSDGGIYYSDNADAPSATQVEFTQLTESLSTIEFYSGDISQEFAFRHDGAAAGGAQDNGSSVATFQGERSAVGWTHVFGGDGIYARIEPKQGNRWYVESQRGNMAVSTNGPFGPYNGSNWPWESDSVLPFLFAFEIHKHDCPNATCDQMLAATNRVFETITGGLNGSSWYPNSPDLSKGVLADRSYINQLSHAIPDPSIAIAGTNDGNVQVGFGMGQGVANSATWVDLTDGNLDLPNRPIMDVVSHGTRTDVFYAAVGGFDANTPTTPGHIYEVECDDAFCTTFTWRNKSGNLPDIPANSVMVNPNMPGQVFAGTDWGLYFTNDVSATEPVWQKFTAGLPSVMIWDMAIDRGATTLALFTRGRGAYAVQLAGAIDQLFADGFGTTTR